MGTYEHVRALDAMLRELQKGNQTLATKAFEMMSADRQELERLRQLASEYEDKIATLNRTYLQEISRSREASRQRTHAVDYGMKDIDNQGVNFYEPLQYFSEDFGLRERAYSSGDEIEENDDGSDDDDDD